MDYLSIINQYYPQDDKLKNILLTHGHSVADKALAIVDRHPELHLDRQFVEEAAMLHDIGIVRCNAPAIYCYGEEPYIRHGLLGAIMLRDHGLDRYARVCERHTGAGIDMQNIIHQNLPLPHQDFLPETLEEQVICYADKFFSKTHLDRERNVEKAERSLARFGEEGVKRFRRWVELFE